MESRHRCPEKLLEIVLLLYLDTHSTGIGPLECGAAHSQYFRAFSLFHTRIKCTNPTRARPRCFRTANSHQFTAMRFYASHSRITGLQCAEIMHSNVLPAPNAFATLPEANERARISARSGVGAKTGMPATALPAHQRRASRQNDVGAVFGLNSSDHVLSRHCLALGCPRRPLDR